MNNVNNDNDCIRIILIMISLTTNRTSTSSAGQNMISNIPRPHQYTYTSSILMIDSSLIYINMQMHVPSCMCIYHSYKPRIDQLGDGWWVEGFKKCFKDYRNPSEGNSDPSLNRVCDLCCNYRHISLTVDFIDNLHHWSLQIIM